LGPRHVGPPPRSKIAWAGVALILLGATGDYFIHRAGYGIAPFLSSTPPAGTLNGTILITDDWALLDVDPGQSIGSGPVRGSFILLMDPMAPNPKDADRADAAHEYFNPLQGAHCKLTGQFPYGVDRGRS